MLRTFLCTRFAVVALLLTCVAASAVAAQTPTAEGALISNSVSATWSDANNGTYTPVTANVDVTVGFLPGLHVTSAATATPASPSTGNIVSYTINNLGNGPDTLIVAVVAATGLSPSGYRVNGTTYTSITALNAALALIGVNAGSSIVVDVIYDVAAGQGGIPMALALTATSKRSPVTTDVATTTITPAVSGTVAVTPDLGTQDRLASNGTSYTETFTLNNQTNASHIFTLGALAVPGTVISIVSVNGTAGTASSITVGATTSASVTVVYTVGNLPAGTVDKIVLTATAADNPLLTDVGDITVRVVRPSLVMTKTAWRDNQTVPILITDRVVPAEYVQYKLSLINSGLAGASGVQITDALPSGLTYNSATGDAAGWSFVVSGSTVTATLSGTLGVAQTRYIWIRARVQ